MKTKHRQARSALAHHALYLDDELCRNTSALNLQLDPVDELLELVDLLWAGRSWRHVDERERSDIFRRALNSTTRVSCKTYSICRGQ